MKAGGSGVLALRDDEACVALLDQVHVLEAIQKKDLIAIADLVAAAGCS
jgi:hypothetical protein